MAETWHPGSLAAEKFQLKFMKTEKFWLLLNKKNWAREVRPSEARENFPELDKTDFCLVMLKMECYWGNKIKSREIINGNL
jgi:hypothetical protein